MPNPVLASLIEQRAQQQTFIDGVLSAVAERGTDLVDAEIANLNSARERIGKLDEQIEPLEAFERAAASHSWEVPAAPQERSHQGGQERGRPAGNQGGQGRQSLTVQPREQAYETPGAFIVDYVRAVGNPADHYHPDRDAAQRVSAAIGRDVVAVHRAANDVAPGVHQTTADTPGLLPEPIIGAILNDLDGARPFLASIGIRPFGAGQQGKTWHRPYITQHTRVGEQVNEKGELVSRELRIDSIPFTKKTFGGYLNISRQDIDWTSPSAWDAVVADLQVQYGLETEDWAAAQFADGVTQNVPISFANRGNVDFWIRALYTAAVQSATANGTKRASSLRLPDHIWTSMDMWAELGAMLTIKNVNAVGNVSPGNNNVTTFNGDILDVPRTMVPGLTAGTVIVGRTGFFEYYEERIGLLRAVEPKVLGVEVAYGGYGSAGFLDATAYTKVTAAASA